MIIVTGATGNTGSLVVQRLARIRRPDSIVALVRSESNTAELEAIGVRIHRCDLNVASSFLSIVEPGASFVGVANLRFSQAMLPHLAAAGVAHAFVVTTTAVYSRCHPHGELYRQIESKLKEASIPVTLLRPSMIYGNNRDHNMRKLIAILGRTPVFPVFGPGTALNQPVFVEDLADGIVRAVERRAVGTYNLAGPVALSYVQLLRTVTGALGRNVRFVHVNHGLASHAVSLLQHIPGFPIRQDQVMRLLEDKAFDISASVSDLDYRPRSFEEGIREEIAQLGGSPTSMPRSRITSAAD